MAGSGKRRMRGKGFWSDVKNWFVGAGQTVNEFLKKTKLISNVAGAVLPLLAPIGTALLTANPLAAAASVGAAKAAAEGIKSLGYGKMHRMPDGSMMKGKMHGGMMMKGGNEALSINPPNQRMRGAGMMKMKGGYSSEDALAVARAITGRGGYGTMNNTVGVNGVPQRTSAPSHSGMIHNIGGRGMHTKAAKMKGMGGTEYGVVSSEFGNVKFT
jgi:hypothetical protein